MEDEKRAAGEGRSYKFLRQRFQGKKFTLLSYAQFEPPEEYRPQ